MVEDTTRQDLPTATGFAARQAIAALRKRRALKSRRCSDASDFQSTTSTIANVVSPLSRK